MNEFQLVGRLTHLPELRVAPSTGKPYTYIRVAVQRNKEKTDFIDMTAFDATAKFLCMHFTKGQWIAIKGHIDALPYEKDGQTVYPMKLVADNVEFCGFNKAAAAAQTQTPEQMTNGQNIPEQDFAYNVIPEALPF